MRTRPASEVWSRFPRPDLSRFLIRGRLRPGHCGSPSQSGTTLEARPPSAQGPQRVQSPESHPEAVTVVAWLQTWLTTRARLRDSTRRGYQGHLRCHLRPRLRGVLLADLDAARLQRLFASMLEAGMTEATVRRVFCTLRSALNAAVRERLIADNPARYVQIPAGRRPHAVIWTRRRVRDWHRTGARPPVAVWTTAQTRRFLKAAAGHRLFAAYHLIALRGLRRGEACGLRWADLDLDAGLAYLTRQVQHVAGKLTACPLKTEASRRAVALDPYHRGAARPPPRPVLRRPGAGDHSQRVRVHRARRRAAVPRAPDPDLQQAGRRRRAAPGAAARPAPRRGHADAVGRRGPEDHRRPARALQHRADRRHLPQRRDRARPCRRGSHRPADPAPRQTATRRRPHPAPQRPATGHRHCPCTAAKPLQRQPCLRLATVRIPISRRTRKTPTRRDSRASCMPPHQREPASTAPEMITTEELAPHGTHPGPTSHSQDH
jgi:integrase